MSYPDLAACVPWPRLFFGAEGETGGERRRRESAAKAICRECTVRDECLADALANSVIWGVWGGTGEAERQRYLSRLRIQAVKAAGN